VTAQDNEVERKSDINRIGPECGATSKDPQNGKQDGKRQKQATNFSVHGFPLSSD
jgi:hypothetical protein